jgi:hypothetical protein
VLKQTRSSAGTARKAEASSVSTSSPSPLLTHAPFSRPMTAPARQMSFQVQQQQPADHTSIPSPSPTSPPLAHHHPLLRSLTKGLSCPLNCNHMASHWRPHKQRIPFCTKKKHTALAHTVQPPPPPPIIQPQTAICSGSGSWALLFSSSAYTHHVASLRQFRPHAAIMIPRSKVFISNQGTRRNRTAHTLRPRKNKLHMLLG